MTTSGLSILKGDTLTAWTTTFGNSVKVCDSEDPSCGEQSPTAASGLLGMEPGLDKASELDILLVICIGCSSMVPGSFCLLSEEPSSSLSPLSSTSEWILSALGDSWDKNKPPASGCKTRPSLMVCAWDFLCLYRLLLVLNENPQVTQG